MARVRVRVPLFFQGQAMCANGVAARTDSRPSRAFARPSVAFPQPYVALEISPRARKIHVIDFSPIDGMGIRSQRHI